MYSLTILLVFITLISGSFSKNCGDVYHDDHGEIVFNRSVTTASQLPDCEWRISVSKNKSILLSIIDADVIYGYKFGVFDGTSESDTSLTEKLDSSYSSLLSSDMRRNFLSSGNNLFIKFRVKEDYILWYLNTPRNYSIHMRYRTVSSGCGGTFNGTEGVIMSPGYPNDYYDKIECKWKIVVPEDHSIIFTFEDFATEPRHDFLKFDEYGLVKFSGREKPSNFISNSNSREIYFETDDTNTDRGFKISYKALALETNKTFLIFATDAIIRSNSSVNYTIAVTGHKVSKFFGFDLKKETIVWFEEHSHQIYIKFSNFTSKSVAIDGKPNCLALDYIHDLIYWIDVKTKSIRVIDINDKNNNIYTIARLEDENPRDLIINVKKSILLWSDVGFEPKIMYSDSNGQNRNILYSESRQAIHLTIDYENQKYFFIDLTDHSLYSIDFDGNNETFYIRSTLFLDIINSMTVLNNNLYLSNEYMIYRIPELDLQILKAHVIYKVHYFPSYELDDFIMTNAKDIQRHKINGFRILDPIEQPFAENRCVNKCQHLLCLPNAQYSHTCLDPTDANKNSPQLPFIDSGQSSRSNSGNALSIVNTICVIFLVLVIGLLSFTIFRLKREMIRLNDTLYYRTSTSRLSLQDNGNGIENDIQDTHQTRSYQNLLELEEKQ